MRHLVLAVVLSLSAVPVLAQGVREYRVLATSKTSTMEKEMNAAAEAGYVYSAVMGGETAFGGTEAVVMQKNPTPSAMAFKLLATSKTSTMQKELDEAGGAGYSVVGMTVSKTAMGGAELVAIARRDR